MAIFIPTFKRAFRLAKATSGIWKTAGAIHSATFPGQSVISIDNATVRALKTRKINEIQISCPRDKMITERQLRRVLRRVTRLQDFGNILSYPNYYLIFSRDNGTLSLMLYPRPAVKEVLGENWRTGMPLADLKEVLANRNIIEGECRRNYSPLHIHRVLVGG